MNKYRVGIIGNGFVGEAISFAFSPVSEILIYDINPLKSTHHFSDVHDCDFVFICVPTPMFQDGSQDLSFVIKAFKKANSKPIYILKSTVLPGTTNNLLEMFPNIKIIFSPEFLTERTSKLDMLTQSRIIFGGDKKIIDNLKKLYRLRFKNKTIFATDSTTAELVKYMNNTFFATKISIMNEFKLLCDKIDGNWEEALKGFILDGRISDSHVDVPGHDGKYGFGGTCFPKDIRSLLFFSNKINIQLNTIEGAWKTNLAVRPGKDWEKKYGRSISLNKEK
jgi:UDPglucose 6-dehydrogenase